MSPSLATLLTLIFVFLLFRRDIRLHREFSRALWIPFWWIVIACSRSASEWATMFGVPVPGGSLEDGSPVDRLVYIGLIVVGFSVLRKRQVSLAQLAGNNSILALFLIYCFLSVFWSDYPFVSLKRWIKVLGHPTMALIILTEPKPAEAFSRVLIRCSYILIPISILFIKYYPDWGRSFSFWTGAASNTGIATDKNFLGINCLILGYLFAWHWMKSLSLPKSRYRTFEIWLAVLFTAMNGWLISVADSKTPLVAMIIGILILLLLGIRWLRNRAFCVYIIGASALFAGFNMVTDLYSTILKMLGRDASLTDRTEVWKTLFDVEINPIFGTGFESFWMGERLEKIWAIWAFRPNQAHNGYLETYLNLGLIGLVLLLLLLMAIYAKATHDFVQNFEWTRFRLGFLFAIIAYNWTEAAFKTTHPIFFMLYIIAIDPLSTWSNSESHGVPHIGDEPAEPQLSLPSAS